MPVDKNLDMPMFFPDGVNNREALEEAIQEFRRKIEEIRETENAYLDQLISDMDSLVNLEMANHINASEEKSANDQGKNLGSVDSMALDEEEQFPFLNLFPQDKSLLEQWKDVFTAEILRAECHYNSLVTKKSYKNFFLSVHPTVQFTRESGDAPQRTQDSGWYATLKQALFG